MLLTWGRFRCKFVGKVGQFSVQLNTQLLFQNSETVLLTSP